MGRGGLALIVALAVGFFNGTGDEDQDPELLITLGTLLMLTGINLAATKLISGQVATPSVNDMAGWALAQKVFSSSFTIAGVSIDHGVVVAVVHRDCDLGAVQDPIGNWIFAVGGDEESARAVGVPVTAVKIGLFMFVGFCAWFAGMHLLFAFNTVQSGQGVGNEFIYIIAAVSAAACSPADTARRSAPRSAPSSSAWCNRASCMPAGTPTGSSSSWA